MSVLDNPFENQTNMKLSDALLCVCIILKSKGTSHLCVKFERPLIISYSLYSENIINYHFYLKHVRRIEVFKLKNWHYLNYKGHFYLCVQRKTNTFLDVYGRI